MQAIPNTRLFFRVRSFSLEKDIKGLKGKEKFEAENFQNFAI